MLKQQPFFGTWNEENKAFWIRTMQEHRDADRLIAGSWFKEDDEKGFVGCFFGCAMQTSESPLEKAITAMGLPVWLIYLAEKIYERLPDGSRLDFPVKLLNAIPAGVDLEPVKHKLAIARLTKLAEKNPTVADCINAVVALHKRVLSGEDLSAKKWESAAWSAAWSARSARSAESAAWSARSAESAAWSAAWSARSARSAESAAWSAACSAAWSARWAESAAWSAAWSARSAAWLMESENLVKFLTED